MVNITEDMYNMQNYEDIKKTIEFNYLQYIDGKKGDVGSYAHHRWTEDLLNGMEKYKLPQLEDLKIYVWDLFVQTDDYFYNAILNK